MLLNPDMRGQVVAIAGACSEAGVSTTRSLASQGAMLMLGGERLSELRALVARIAEEGGCAQYRAADPTRQASIDMLVDHTLDAYGRIDLLLNLGAKPSQPLVGPSGIGRGCAKPSAQSPNHPMDAPPWPCLLHS